ncbi:MBOAT family O-acyltransferase [Ferribacterium limneticum]|uniref:MBOAT family O-acyltransferase n=1 Tax=Ferribacterium limneticum TaxID=76259 RepID=UPI001CFB9415|nr:MBOAT family O-acyltransferase [Ferribacterium limneticum]UCV29287.1 MBOAT family protein [Ferribacterium limneticum]UCV33206.1 MBOAT family protein [Ferribacterium limneticum]
MLFNTFSFVVFLVVVLAAYWLTPGWNRRKLVLLVASYLFYAAWSPPFVFLLFFVSWLNWVLARHMAATQEAYLRHGFLLASLLSSLGLLSYFKYGTFLFASFSDLVNALGGSFSPPELDIVLPIGISFYTFHALSYTIDCYRGRLVPNQSFSDFALYVGFFPQLVAGPIVRASNFMPQLLRQPLVSRDHWGWGGVLLLLGLFHKVVLADAIFAPVADQLYSAPGDASFGDAWLGVLAFSCQIYCDFAGYSTCAIGLSMLFGFALPENFQAPFAAVGFSDFWQRWHISLSSWLRDYLYISMGGSHAGHWSTARNLMLTMAIGGLWHGASWMFVIWGVLHGFYLVVERFVVSQLAFAGRYFSTVGLALGTFTIVTLTWIPFRSSDLAQATAVIEALFRPGNLQILPDQLLLLISAVGALVFFQIRNRERSFSQVFQAWPLAAQSIWLSGAALGLFLFSGGDSRGFIYFQF